MRAHDGPRFSAFQAAVVQSMHESHGDGMGNCSLLGGFFQLKFLDAVPNLVAINPKQRRGLGLVPGGALQRLNDQRAFELLEIDAARRQFDAIAET